MIFQEISGSKFGAKFNVELSAKFGTEFGAEFGSEFDTEFSIKFGTEFGFKVSTEFDANSAPNSMSTCFRFRFELRSIYLSKKDKKAKGLELQIFGRINFWENIFR